MDVDSQGCTITTLDDDFERALLVISDTLYCDASHWKLWVPAWIDRIGQVADAGIKEAASDLGDLIKSVSHEITSHISSHFIHVPPFTAPRAAELLLSPVNQGYRLALPLHVLVFLQSLSRVLLVSSSILDYPQKYDDVVQDSGPQLVEITWPDSTKAMSDVEDTVSAPNEPPGVMSDSMVDVNDENVIEGKPLSHTHEPLDNTPVAESLILEIDKIHHSSEITSLDEEVEGTLPVDFSQVAEDPVDTVDQNEVIIGSAHELKPSIHLSKGQNMPDDTVVESQTLTVPPERLKIPMDSLGHQDVHVNAIASEEMPVNTIDQQQSEVDTDELKMSVDPITGQEIRADCTDKQKPALGSIDQPSPKESNPGDDGNIYKNDVNVEKCGIGALEKRSPIACHETVSDHVAQTLEAGLSIVERVDLFQDSSHDFFDTVHTPLGKRIKLDTDKDSGLASNACNATQALFD